MADFLSMSYFYLCLSIPSYGGNICTDVRLIRLIDVYARNYTLVTMSLIVITSAVDCLRRLVFQTRSYLSSGMLKLSHSLAIYVLIVTNRKYSKIRNKYSEVMSRYGPFKVIQRYRNIPVDSPYATSYK